MKLHLNAALVLFLVLYAGLAKPELPSWMVSGLESLPVRLVVLTLVARMATNNLQTALIVSVVFVMAMNLLNQQHVAEHFVSEIQYDSFSGEPFESF